MDRKNEAFLKMLLIIPGDASLDPTGKEFNWTRDEIITWLKAVSASLPNNPKIPNNVVQQLTDVAKFIEELSLPEGTKLVGKKDTSEWPPHHFARQRRDIAYDRKGNPVKRFTTMPKDIFGNKVWNLYDALGYFLMGVARTPKTATKANFYMPLTAMYGKWCMKLGGHADTDKNYLSTKFRVGKWPTVFQCTWLDSNMSFREGERFPFRFSLGASFAGCDFSENIPGILNRDWRERLIQQRVQRLQHYGLFPAGDGSKQNPWPEQATTGSAWGNCGEVYPFCMIFSLAEKAGDVYGLALSKSGLENDTNKEYDQKALMDSRNVWAPCDNCKWVFSYRWGGTKEEKDGVAVADLDVYEKFKHNWLPSSNMARAG